MEPRGAAELDFGGAWGAGALTLLLPLALVQLVGTCGAAPGTGTGWGLGWGLGWGPPPALPSPPAVGLVLAWVASHGLLCLLPPRKVTDGPGPGSSNGNPRGLSGVAALGGALGGALAGGLLPLPPLPQLLPQLAAAASALAFGLALLLHLRGPRRGPGGPVYGFFVGRGPGPRLGALELSRFCRLRPGLGAWAVLDAALVLREAQLRGGPSLPLALVAAGQGLYVLQRLRHEAEEGPPEAFGFLGAFGALAWLPFGASLPAQFLLARPRRLALPAAAALVLLYALGFVIFRGAKAQKSLFSRDPQDPRVAGLPTVPTATGRLLLAGGWWGLVRRPDDLGDLLMALAWSLPCGLSHPVPYAPLAAGAALLGLRAAGDERRCRRRFGLAWEQYCRRVPYRLVPYVY